ncbi:RES family NAD+ phosphorylase [Rhodovulum sp. DZ06]|uniref:RES family NAD+ phosphorylase n=1 Tax=Rhodovulum sp. DZ06 TaxID=3425126 RepID=UPI003D3487FB
MTAGPPRPFSRIEITDRRFLRLVRWAHPDPLGVGPGGSRFVPAPGAAGGQAFRALYAARDLATAFAETILRDEAVDRPQDFPVAMAELEAWSVVELRVRALSLVDLTGDAPLRARIASDAVRARDQAEGRRLGAEIHADPRGFDGALYPSRLTTGENIVVFERAISRGLAAEARGPLLDAAGFGEVLDRFRVGLV